MKTFDDYLEEAYWRMAFDLVETQLKAAEKAHPSLPDSVEELIESGLGRYREWQKLYYLPEDECVRTWDERVKAWKRYYQKLWDAWKELDSPYEFEPPLLPGVIERSRGWLFFEYSVTSCRECFEEMKEKLKDCKTLDDVLEKLGVQKAEEDL